MTRKDYEAAAAIVRSMRRNAMGDPTVARIRSAGAVKAFFELFSADNPRFDGDKFIDACEPDSSYKNRSRSRLMKGSAK